MSTTTIENGRLCNQIFRNVALSIIAQRHNLYVTYSSYETIQQLGINLFIGENRYTETRLLTDDNYFDILSNSTIQYNLNPNHSYFQTKDISIFLYNYFHSLAIQENIKKQNPFHLRYNNNNDLCIHFRLGDIAKTGHNLDITYYINATKQLPIIPTNIFLCTDEPTHPFIKQYMDTFPNTILIDDDPKSTIQFASTCKYIILSHGSFSAIIGYLAFYSEIYYQKYNINKMWYGDMFSIPGWNCIS